MPRKQTPESQEARSRRIAREKEARLLRNAWGLSGETLHAAVSLPGDALDLLASMGASGSIQMGREIGPELARLSRMGFIEFFQPAHGGRIIARVAPDGLRALCLRRLTFHNHGGARPNALGDREEAHP
ncbi:MAG: hypothetical protein ACREDO_05860 [Methyloceanibacter sp.]